MKNNSQCTALEVLKATGAEKFVVDEKEYSAEEVFGKVSVVIGGISGIVSPNHLIGIPSGVSTLNVTVGVQSFQMLLEDNEGEREHSAGKVAVLESENVPEAAPEVSPEA